MEVTENFILGQFLKIQQTYWNFENSCCLFACLLAWGVLYNRKHCSGLYSLQILNFMLLWLA